MPPNKLLLYLFLPLLVGIGLTTDAQRLHPRDIASAAFDTTPASAKRDSLTSPGQSPGHSSNPCSGCKGCEETEPPPCCKNCAVSVSTRAALDSLLDSRLTPASSSSFSAAAAAAGRAHPRDIGIDTSTITTTTQRDDEPKASIEAQSQRRLRDSGGDGGYGEDVLVKRRGPPSCASCYGCEAYMKAARCSNCSAVPTAAAPLFMGRAVEDHTDHHHHQPPHHPHPPKTPCDTCRGCNSPSEERPSCCALCPHLLERADVVTDRNNLGLEQGLNEARRKQHPTTPRRQSPCDTCQGCSKAPGERPPCCPVCHGELVRSLDHDVLTSTRENLGIDHGLNEARGKKPAPPPDCPICTGCDADPPKRPSCCGKCFGEDKRALTDTMEARNVAARQKTHPKPPPTVCSSCHCTGPVNMRPGCCQACHGGAREDATTTSTPRDIPAAQIEKVADPRSSGSFLSPRHAPRKLIIGRDDFDARGNKLTPTVHEDRVRPPPHKPPKCTGCKNCDLHPPHRPACCAECPHAGLVAAGEERSTLDYEELEQPDPSTLRGSSKRAAELEFEERKHHEDPPHSLGKHAEVIADIQAADIVVVGARQDSKLGEVQPRFHKNPPMCKGCNCGGPKLKRPACCSHCHGEQEEAAERATTEPERLEKRHATVTEDEADLDPRKHNKPHKDPCAHCNCGGAPEVRPPCCFKCRPPLDATSTTLAPRDTASSIEELNGQATKRDDPDPCSSCLGCAVPPGFYRPACCPSCGYPGTTALAKRGQPFSEVSARGASPSTPLPRQAAPSTLSTRNSASTMLKPRDSIPASVAAEQHANKRDPPPDPCDSCLGCYPAHNGYRPACCASCGGYQVSTDPAKRVEPFSEASPRKTAPSSPLPRLAASSTPSGRDWASTTLFSRDSPILATTPVERAAGVIEVKAAEDLNERFHKTPCYACTKCSGPPPRPECCGRCASVLEATTTTQRGPVTPSLDPGLGYAKELPRGGNDPENDPCTTCEDCDLPLSARPSCCGVCHTSKKKKKRSESGGGERTGATGGVVRSGVGETASVAWRDSA